MRTHRPEWSTPSSGRRYVLALCLMISLFLAAATAVEAGQQVQDTEGRAPAARARYEKACQELRAVKAEARLEGVRRAVEHLMETFPVRYPRGPAFLEELDAIEAQWAEVEEGLARGDASALEDGAEACAAMLALRRKALIDNPLVVLQPILFVVRKQYRPDHHNTATLFQKGEINTGSFTGGAALKTIDFRRGGFVRTLLSVPEGVVRDPEVHFSGEKILFSMRKNIDDDFHLYEIGADGKGLRQLTFAEGVSDFDPLYLPDDHIAFSSTREPKYCMCNRHIMANLFRMEPDGANIHQIGKSTLFEGHGALMPDGRILYDRWEYVDRNFGDAQGLWTVNPDGTNHAVYFGNNTASPGAVIDGRIVPKTGQVLCVFGSCHDRPWGALALVDRRLGLDGKAPVVRTWPEAAADLVGAGDWDTFKQVLPRYEDPFPLSETCFLCSRMTGDGEQMGVYLIDLFGNELLLHAEGPGCYDPMPLGPRERPPVIPSRRGFASKEGCFYVADVYQGTHMQGVEKGAVKYLRVVESPEKRFWTHTMWGGQGTIAPAMNWHDFNNKRILGTVPVEEDGSAYFMVPSDRFVYFQLLDAKGMMIQSMRSGTMVQPGETSGCVGCHDERRQAPPPAGGGMPLALRRPPSLTKGWQGPPRFFSYMEEVQPVLDRACVRCHDFQGEGAGKLLLAGDRTLTFNVSYNELWRKKYIHAVGAGPAQTLPPYAWGSHASKLVHVLLEGHQDIELDARDFDRIVTWIDINAPYYPSYASAYPENLGGRSPLDNAQIERLSLLTGVPLSRLANHAANQGPKVCFERPELSPCLDLFENRESPEYGEALAIIRAGRAMLDLRPRADMPGFEPCPADLLRQEKYALRMRAESMSREAIREGAKVHDDSPDAPARNPIPSEDR